MLGPESALRRILASVEPLRSEEVPLELAAGRVLAEPFSAREDLPTFPNSAMDGYALRAADAAAALSGSPVRLPLRGLRRAGDRPGRPLPRGSSIRIMTGAPLPAGADAVVRQEAARVSAGALVLERAPRAGEHVRQSGEDVVKGRALLKRGRRLRPYDVALLAAQGIPRARVIRRPVVAVASTGDELVAPASRLTPGRVRDCNGPSLRSALARWSIPVLPLGAVRDDRAALRRAFARGLASCDALLVCGGVSVGEFDYTREVLADLGVRAVFWGLAIKPGKPLFFGTRPRRGGPAQAVFGLPGNPVAALLCLEEFVRPALEKMQGQSSGHPSYHLRGTALNDYPTPPDRAQYLFCEATPDGDGYGLKILRPQGSAMLGMAAKAEALALAPADARGVRAGDTLPFRWLK